MLIGTPPRGVVACGQAGRRHGLRRATAQGRPRPRDPGRQDVPRTAAIVRQQRCGLIPKWRSTSPSGTGQSGPRPHRARAARRRDTGPPRPNCRRCRGNPELRITTGGDIGIAHGSFSLAGVGMGARDARPARDRRGIRSAPLSRAACARREGPSRPPPTPGVRRGCEDRCR